MNNTRIGGYLFYYGWPEWMVMADPRMEIAGEESLRLWQGVFAHDDEFERMVSEHDVHAVVIDLWDDYLRDFGQRVYDHPDWALVLIDREHNAMVFLKRGSQWKTAIDKYEITL